MPKQKIISRRRITPQRVWLPNRQFFVARYERVSRQNFPRNIIVTGTRQIGLQNKRKPETKTVGSIFGTIARLGTKSLTSTGLLRKGLGVGARAIDSEVGKNLINEGIKHALELYRLRTYKIRNKNMKKAFESKIDDYVVKEAQKKAADNVENLFG